MGLRGGPLAGWLEIGHGAAKNAAELDVLPGGGGSHCPPLMYTDLGQFDPKTPESIAEKKKKICKC